MRHLLFAFVCTVAACGGQDSASSQQSTGDGGGKADGLEFWCSPTQDCPSYPPSDHRCSDDDTLKNYSSGGQCVNNTCVYPSTTTECDGTCAINRCLPACDATGFDVQQIVVPLPNDLNDRSRNPDVVVDEHGNMHITSTNRDLVEVEYYENTSGNWARRVVGQGSESLIARDSHGVPHFVYRDPATTALNTTFTHAEPDGDFYWKKDGIGSGIQGNGDGDALSFAIDRDDTLHVAYRDRESKHLMHSYRTTSMSYWMTETVSTASFGGHTVAAIAPDGSLVVAAFRPSTSSFTLARKSGATPWTVENVTTPGPLPLWISLAFDADGREQVAYPAKVGSQWNLYLSARDASTWETEMVDENVGATTTLVVTPAGRQVLAYGVKRDGADQGLWSAERDPHGTWQKRQLEQQPSSYPLYFESSAAADATGTVRLVYWAYAFGTRTQIATSCD